MTELTNISCPVPTVLPTPTEYMVEIEIDTLNAAVLNQLRTLLKSFGLPVVISDAQITELNITTACLLNNTGYQCRCEDQYFWPCNKCAAYGPCDNINNVTCGCINAFPNDGQFCQPMTELTNITPCPTPSPTVPSSPIEYMIEIEIDTLDAAVLNQLRTVLKNLSLPFGISDVQINELNVTTVCLSNNTGYQCRCEDQYFWPCNKCAAYGPCDNVNNVTCGCIRAVPVDGQFCQPMTELTNITPCPTPSPTVPSSPSEYMIEMEIDTVDAALVNELRTLLKSFSLPYIISDVQINELNITTVPSSPAEYMIEMEIDTVDAALVNELRTVLKNLSLPFGISDVQINELNITTGTSTLSTSTGTTAPDMSTGTTAPNTTAGSTAPNTTTGTTAPYTTPGTTAPNMTTRTTVPDMTTGTTAPDTTTGTTALDTTEVTTAPDMTAGSTAPDTTTGTTAPDTTKVTTAPDTTTVPTAPDTTTETTALKTTTRISAPVPTTGVIVPVPTTEVIVPVPTTGVIVPVPTTGVIVPVPTTEVIVPVPTAPAEYTITLSLTIDETFDNSLTVKSSPKYQKYSTDITSSVDSAYSAKLSSYKAGSAKVIQFRPGSVIADFTITTTSNTLDFSAANKQLVSALSGTYRVTEDSFAQTVENGLYDRKGNIYPGKDIDLTCNPPALSTGGITWSFNDKIISTEVDSSQYQISADRKTLTVKSTSDQDSGKYACKTTLNSIPYIIWQKMVIQPLPNIRATTSKTIYCDGSPITQECCAENSYKTKWSLITSSGPQQLTDPTIGCSSYSYPGFSEADCKDGDKIVTFLWEVFDLNGDLSKTNRVRITATGKSLDCYDKQFGAGKLNDLQTGSCDVDSVGTVTALCTFSTTDKGTWKIVEDNCILRALQELIDKSENLQVADVPQFTADLRDATESNSAKITESEQNVLTVVLLMTVIANVSQSFIVDKSIMTDFLKTSDVISATNARNIWEQLNKKNTTQKTSSDLLKSTEEIGGRLTDDSFSISTNSTQLERTKTYGPFFGTFGVNSTTQIDIPELNGQTLITTIVFSAYDNVLPVRNATYNDNKNVSTNDSIYDSKTDTTINGDVVAVIVNNTVYNISLTFDIKNESLRNPQCVFWNYSLLDGDGGWDSTGCEIKPLVNQTGKFKCECNHTTSFSILMSPFFVDNLALAFITFICVGISIICLILALIIEIIVWKPLTRNETSYMRHVSIVNIALSLLIADICFIIGAAIVKDGEQTPVGPCSTATFFMHFFYLALFFWMLFSALLLLYRTIMVFARMSKSIMMAIAFFVGYGAPLLIAVITVAVTAGGGGYIQEKNACWLNWFKTKALLAFVIPALTIVAVNLLVLVVVLYKMLRRGIGNISQPDEKHPLLMIAKCVAILTPLFGLTWGFGIGTMVSSALGIHIVFALLNSLQGFFVLVFGILLDSKIREALAERLKLKNLKNLTFSGTRSTSAGPSSSSGPRRNRRSRNGYHVSSGSGSSAVSSSSIADTVTNT
ncbi:adhesion G protein-coupled receptor F5-like [Colossoma macropomum]|uniref:adhesion G protein-coupled receptor F5-like n=1 Tax=Colossoma macropomum TaxID=42526 RepID=UPI001864DF9F|nr:adhesion G protein-coupled receptor F5-like [Colossoma macropomum]